MSVRIKGLYIVYAGILNARNHAKRQFELVKKGWIWIKNRFIGWIFLIEYPSYCFFMYLWRGYDIKYQVTNSKYQVINIK